MFKITLVGQPRLKDVFVLFLYLYLYLYILFLLYLLQVVFVQGDPSTAHCYKLYSRPHPLITLFSVQAGTNSLVCNRNLSASRWKFCHCKSYREHLIGGFAKTLWCLTPSPTSSGQVTKRENLKWASQLILRSNSRSLPSHLDLVGSWG